MNFTWKSVSSFIQRTIVFTEFCRLKAHGFNRDLVSGEITDGLRYQLIAKLTRLSPKTLYQFKQGDLANRVTQTCSSIEFYFKFFLLPSCSHVLRSIGILIFMVVLNVKLAAISLLLIPMVCWVSY
ncbi:ABC transporter transmembrane domain-containing protein [Paenactinomyces guangxiensis]|uniref:ABC transporter ATP-binding protein n=1 Tax=Paenactinomyces guangxiensis TaxID=1490290 RepID=A0A7W1WQF2_9BACL|nr:ABC transporter ATP-binding protein [Paenactinomyces guangxiensis]MBH8593412.1 ABC transporter ATP-binding protein [Paenactinomyces guangxiensis]